MKFEIDMSGCDLLNDGRGIIRGFQISQEIIDGLLTNWRAEKYFCRCSKRGFGFFKAMIYSSVICCLLEFIGKPREVELEICRDLRFHENNIRQRLNKLLRKKLSIKVNSIIFKNLKGSDVDNYAYLMFKDNYNLLPTYINLTLNDLEKFLI